MVRIFAFGIGLMAQAIEVVFSLLGLIAAVIGAGIALALCGIVVGGLVAIVSFFLVLFG